MIEHERSLISSLGSFHFQEDFGDRFPPLLDICPAFVTA